MIEHIPKGTTAQKAVECLKSTELSKIAKLLDMVGATQSILKYNIERRTYEPKKSYYCTTISIRVDNCTTVDLYRYRPKSPYNSRPTVGWALRGNTGTKFREFTYHLKIE